MVSQNGKNLENRIMVSGGGGGAATNYLAGGVSPTYPIKINGGDAGISESGNSGTKDFGSNATSNGGGGGGGYYGGTAGTLTKQSTGGSNFIKSGIGTILGNGTSDNKGAGYCNITIKHEGMVLIDPNGGTYESSKEVKIASCDITNNETTNFVFKKSSDGSSYRDNYGSWTSNPPNGTVESYTAKQSGYYYIQAWGAKGGDDQSRGGNGGYVSSYTYLTKNQTIYIACGGLGQSANNGGGGWNGGARTGGYGYSGGGGGCTSITTTNRGVLANFANYKNEVLVVAGGGAGGSYASAGLGGNVLYVGDGTNFPGTNQNGATTYYLNGVFANGSSLPSSFRVGTDDGGGGGGGWVGGRNGVDAAGNPAGGGASYVNISNNSIGASLVASNNDGAGKASITFRSDIMVLENPVREGYIFDGWELTGSGTLSYNSLAKKYIYQFTTGTGFVKAKWKKNDTIGKLNINLDGGIYEGNTENLIFYGYTGSSKTISTPLRYGFEFKGWTFSGEGSFSNNTYYFASNQTGTLKANWQPICSINIFVNLPNTQNSLTKNTSPGDWYWYENYWKLYALDDTTISYSPNQLFSLKGYTIDSNYYYTNSNGTGTKYTKDSKGFPKIAETINLYVHWKPNNYQIKYEKGLTDDAKTSPANTKHVYDTDVTLTKNTFTGKSYKLLFDTNLPKKYDNSITKSIPTNVPDTITGNLSFDKWNVKGSYNSGLYTDNTNLGAKNFESEEGAVSVATATYLAKTVTFSNPSLSGYQFDGWFTKASGGNIYTKEINTSSTVIKPNTSTQIDTLYAHWTPNTYCVVYKNYDGHGNDYTQNCTYDKLYNYLNNPSDLSDSIFLGWYAKENPSSLTDGVISGGTSFTNLTSVDNGIIYVYGKWSKTNLTEDAASKNPVFIKTDQIKIDGSNVYKDPTRDKTYFIKNDTQFALKFNGLIDSQTDVKFLPMITNVNTFTLGKLETSINNNEFVFDKTLPVNPINTINELNFIETYEAIRKNNSTPGTNKTLLSYKQSYTLSGDKDGKLLEIIPHSSSTLIRTKNGKNYTTTYNTKDSDDKNHNIFIECDSTKPTITNSNVYELGSNDYNPLISKKTDIEIKYADFIKNVDSVNPKYGSGVDTKNIKLTITQEQDDDDKPSISKVYTDSSVQEFVTIKVNDLYSGTVTLHVDPDKYSDMSGFINFKLEITDNVGNTATKEYRILILDFNAKVLNASPGERNGTNKFAQGESGKIEIETNGFADKVEFAFPSNLDNLAQNEKSNAGDIENPFWQEGRVLSDTYPRDKDGNVTTVFKEMQTKLWGTENIGGMQWNKNTYEHCSLIHYFYAPLYSQNGKYQVLVTIYKTDPLDNTKVYTIQKTYDFYIGQNSDDPLDIIAPITEEFRDKIKDN